MPDARAPGDPHDWMTQQFPELALLPDHEARRKAIEHVRNRVFGANPLFYVYLVALVGVTLLAAKTIEAWLVRGVTWLGLPGWIGLALFIAIVIYIYYLGIAVLFVRAVRAGLRRYLLAQRIAVCIRCGYDCRANHEPRCPECGTRFDAKLLSQQPP